jgi:hypothetical protein
MTMVSDQHKSKINLLGHDTAHASLFSKEKDSLHISNNSIYM